MQVAGAFKIRGAANMLARFGRDELAGGVITYSSGNHAQALACAARLLGVPAVVVMPTTAPAVKVNGTRVFGAHVIFAGTTSAERKAEAERLQHARGLVMVPPFDHPWIIAGQGTVGLEILEQVPDVDTIVVPIGGGGLIAGIATAAAGRARVLGVEPELSTAMHSALAAGERVEVTPSSIADGLNAPHAGRNALAIVRERVEDVVLVSEDEIMDAFRFLYERAKLACEPAGAAAVAALMAGKVAGDRVVAVVSGGNVGAQTASAILAQR
jgi:threo-3-hydroxy-L-aspartate ammonia-lyase